MPRRCLHGVHPLLHHPSAAASFFASALPARGASPRLESRSTSITLCLGAACTGCIAAGFAKASTKFSLPRRCLHGVHHRAAYLPAKGSPLPRRCLHGVHLGCAVVALYAVHFASALPARGASLTFSLFTLFISFASALPARGASGWTAEVTLGYKLCLGAACTGCILGLLIFDCRINPLPRRCLHGVHLSSIDDIEAALNLCLGAACTGCIGLRLPSSFRQETLPRRCLHGVHHGLVQTYKACKALCLGAACTGCIGKSRQIAAHHFVAYAVSR